LIAWQAFTGERSDCGNDSFAALQFLGWNQIDRQRRCRMDSSRKANREENEKTLQYRSPHDALLVEELNEEKVTQLLARISQSEQTPVEAAELQRRIKSFGECKRIEGETAVLFYARLHHWLDRDLPSTKSPRHAPRQTGD
jgi:hypothetical protein